MDNDDYRRGKLTNHKVYGAGIATLAGDALLTLAFEVILRQKADSETLCRVIREISQAAGPDGMVGGQAIDMESEGKSITMDELRKMHMGKTGALFRAAIRSGAILAGAGETELNALTRYAEAFGLAFQITDDILDVIGDENEIGKPVGSDERNHKSTYVTLTSLEKARQLAKDAVDEAVLALEPFGDKAWFLKELVEFLISRKK
jgi:geranylgeranyl diphosphate synthase type II